MKTRIVIVGAGFGGLEAAFSLKALLKPSAEITVIDRSPSHSFIPSIHLIVSGRITADQIRIPLKVVLGAAGVRFIQDEVTGIDTDMREAVTGRARIPYDYLVLSSGATDNFLHVTGAQRFSCPFRTPEDAERIRSRLACLFHDEARTCRVVLAGAGTEGVEVIGELLDLLSEEGRESDFRAGRITIELIEGKSRLLPSFPVRVQDFVEEYLKQRGVILTAGDRIAEARQDSVLLASGNVREASILIWAAGVQPSKLISNLPFPRDPWGWLRVTESLQVPGEPSVFGIGDAVSISTEDGPLALQRLAYHAQDQARVAALNISYGLRGEEQIAYRPKTRPQLISLGRNMGVLTFEDRVYSGPWVVALKKAIERKHLMSCLGRPVSSAVWSRVPGAGLFQRMRTRFPA